MEQFFRNFAQGTSRYMGSSWAFLVACLVILMWAVSGPAFGFSDTWQLVINTSTTIVTFLMVFLIQNTQNRDAKAIQLKLDELIRGVQGARTGMVGLEGLSDDELAKLEEEFEHIREEHDIPVPGEHVVARENTVRRRRKRASSTAKSTNGHRSGTRGK